MGEIADRLTTLAPLTLAATKESIRRIQAARALDSQEGEDLILSCYMSDDFARRCGLSSRSASTPGLVTKGSPGRYEPRPTLLLPCTAGHRLCQECRRVG